MFMTNFTLFWVHSGFSSDCISCLPINARDSGIFDKHWTEAAWDLHFVQMCHRYMWNCYILVLVIILMKYPTYSDYAFKNHILSSLEENLSKNFSSSENQEWAWMKGKCCNKQEGQLDCQLMGQIVPFLSP